MPIYEYECKACGHRLEAIQKISDPALTDCPECNKAELKKLISAAAFRLKGGGWYETDFKNDKKKNLAQSDASKGASKESTGDKSTSEAPGKQSTPEKSAKSATTKSSGSADA